MSLTGKTIAASYKDVLQIDNSNNGMTTSTKAIKSGDGTSSCVKISDDQLAIQPINDDTTTLLNVATNSGTALLVVDSTNSTVKALGNHLNTQYAYFGTNYVDFSTLSANTHYAIPFSASNGGASATNDVDFGTGTDPSTTFTTANTDTQYASQLVPCLWFVPEDITIDSVTSIEGADAATGDTTRMHLYSFTLNSGATGALTSGTLLAHNSDTTNAGNEQLYKSSWTIDSANVTGGKVLMCFFRSDSVNSDYSLNITVKYHLT